MYTKHIACIFLFIDTCMKPTFERGFPSQIQHEGTIQWAAASLVGLVSKDSV